MSGEKMSKQESSWGWKAVAAGAAAAVAVGAAVYYLAAPSPKKLKSKKEKKSKRSTQKQDAPAGVSGASAGVSGASAGASGASSIRPQASEAFAESKQVAASFSGETKSSAVPVTPPKSNKEFLGLMMESMEEIQQTGKTDGEREQRLWTLLRQLNPGDYDARVRLVGAQWMILFHTIRTMTASTQEEFHDAVQHQGPDMETAWKLLDCTPTEETEKNAVDLLRLDVAQRMKDPNRMIPVFERVMARGDDMSYEEVVVAFTTAPLLGRWKALRELGDKIISKHGNLEEFHQAALHRPDIPDYEVLYQLAAEEMKKGDANHAELQWQILRISSLRIKLQSVVCADETKHERVKQAFDPKGTREWQEIPVGAETRMLRFGAIAQMLSLSTVPIPMVGPASNDKMRVLGYAVIKPPQGNQQVRQTETYDVTRTDERGVWTGSYSLLQQIASTDLPDSDVKIIFDMEMTLEEVAE